MVVYLCMKTQLKNMNRASCVVALALVGALSSSSLAGDQDERRWKTTPSDHAARRALMTSSGNSSALMFSPGVQTEGSFYTYERDMAPEFSRRDAQLSISVPNATAGWYAWPVQARPSLNDRDYFTVSSNPNTFIFPGSDGYSSHDQYQREVRRDRILKNQKHIYIHRSGSRGNPSKRNRVR